MTGKLRSRRTDALRRRRRLRYPAEPPRRCGPHQCRRLYRSAVLRRRGGRPPQQRVAVGEITADHPFTDFTDSARYVSLWRLRHARRGRKPRRIPASQTSRAACWARVRCDRRGSVPKVDVTMGMYRGARTC
jgi:hypothetical protein